MSDDAPPPDASHRRGFLAGAAALALGGVATLAAAIPGLSVLLDPLRRTRSDAGFVLVTRLGGIPEDGVPRKFTVIAERKDAWTNHGDTPVGAVYLRRTAEAGISALNVVCPHAGCFVGVKADRTGFACPCHKSSFDLAGGIDDPSSPAPRAMDELDVEVRNGNEVWVRFLSFQPGLETQVPQV